MKKVGRCWCCEKCDFRSTYKHTMIEHVADEHYGLTVEEYTFWRSLRANVKKATKDYSEDSNRMTHYAYKKALDTLILWEDNNLSHLCS